MSANLIRQRGDRNEFTGTGSRTTVVENRLNPYWKWVIISSG